MRSGEHGRAAAAFEPIAAEELRFRSVQVSESRNIERSGRPSSLCAAYRLVPCQAVNGRSHHVFAEIMAYVAARIADAVRIGSTSTAA